MRNSKRIAMVLAGITALGVMMSPAAAEEEATRVVTDVFGREVEIPEEVDKIDCLCGRHRKDCWLHRDGTSRRSWNAVCIC